MNHLCFVMRVWGTQSVLGGFQVHYDATIVNMHINRLRQTACLFFILPHLLLSCCKEINVDMPLVQKTETH